jgi:Flp pilus assembly protein TadG
MAALRNTDGVAAIEFAMVSLPFFMMMFGLILVGLYFFTTFTLENAVEQAARLIRTGQVQQQGMSADDFKLEVCKWTPQYVDCDGKLRVNVQSYAGFGDVVTPSCTDSGGNLIPPAATLFETGASSEVVLVTVCYEWELAGKLPFLQLSNMANGSALIQAASTFRTEPYED